MARRNRRGTAAMAPATIEQRRIKQREYVRRYRERHPEKIAEYKATHAKEMAEYSRRYHAENAERERAYRQRTSSQNVARAAAWQRANPDKVRVHAANTRAKRRGAGGPGMTPEEWDLILEWHDHRCAYCGKHSDKLEQDHVIALSRNGSHDPDNIVPACRSCNARKGYRSILSMANVEYTTETESAGSRIGAVAATAQAV